MKSHSISIKKYLKFFDLYGQTVNLYIEKSTKFKSQFGGFLSIGILFFISYCIFGVLISWAKNEKITVITSESKYSVNELLRANKNHEYELNYRNFYPYFVIRADLPEGTIYTQKMMKYFSFDFTYSDTCGQIISLGYEFCRDSYYDTFLEMDKQIIKEDEGKINKNRICLKESVKIGLYVNSTISTLNAPEIHFQIYGCKNSTENQYSCASPEEIDEIIPNVVIQATIPLTLYDFQNTQKPQQNFHDFSYIRLDKLMYKYVQNQLIPTFLFADYGYLYEDYRLHATNFNPNIFFDPLARKESQPFYDYMFAISLDVKSIYLRNQKFNEILASLGGIINAIFLLGKILCMSYNSFILKHKIIKSTFSQPKKQSGNLKSSSQMKNSRFLPSFAQKVSCWNFIFPSRELKLFYSKGANYIHEYIDIRKIIKKLQDVDKLKMILLNEEQRKLFARIPKPEIFATTNSRISIQSILKESKKMRKEPLPQMNRTDSLSKRILSCIEPKEIDIQKGLLIILLI